MKKQRCAGNVKIFIYIVLVSWHNMFTHEHLYQFKLSNMSKFIQNAIS